MNEEKIVKVLECCIKEKHKDCVHCGEFVSQFDCMRNAISNALDLIHRLQDENEQLKSTKYRASWKEKFFNLKKEFDKELAEHEEFTKKAKAEIERLTEEKDKYQEKWQTSYMNELNLQKQVNELKAFQKDIQIEFFKALNQESEITKANVEARCADRIQELEEALLDMVAQFCEMGEEGKLCHTFMSAEEQAFDVLGIEYGEDIDEVYKRFNDKWNGKNQKWECF